MKKLHFFGVSFFLFVLIAQNTFAATREWELDPAHSNVYFSVGHVYAKVQGHFNELTAKVNFDPANLKDSRFFFKIRVDSIDTGISKRDKHLLSADFFESSTYPLITFESKTISDAGNGVYEVVGRLNIKGKEHELKLPLVFAGVKEHPAVPGKQVIGFNGKITVDRLALNVGDEKYYKMGLVGKDVEVLVSFEALAAK